LLVIGHRALLSAAATIARGLPADSVAVTRRAVEVALVAVAAKHDESNLVQWLSSEQRLARWNARDLGEKPEVLKVNYTYPTLPLVHFLKRDIGTLSDMGTHFTPEFVIAHPTRIEKREDGGGIVHYSYFQTDQREIERSLAELLASHFRILGAFDSHATKCGDGYTATLR
jgi:hypothetical protein